MSDLHVDAARYDLPETPAGVDCIIIAGDVADGFSHSRQWIRERVNNLSSIPLVYVLGNHDYFGADLDWDYAGFFASAGGHLLHPDRPSITIAGVRIVGLTLWTDYAVAGNVDVARSWARREMPDLRSIDRGLRRANTRDFVELHRRHLEVLESELSRSFDGPTMVVTHHAPHRFSLRAPALPTAGDGSFASDLSKVIQRHKPPVWLHGHIHQSQDYYFGATRIICNPRGYAVAGSKGLSVGNIGFEPDKIIEI